MSDNTKQLYRKSSDGSYPKIFPLAFIQGIKDKRNDKELLSYINEINHFKVDYNENSETTRCQVDNFIRKKGLYITYYNTDTNENITEYFKGNQSDVTDDSIWGNSDNWELVPDKTYIESHAVIPNKSITMNKLADDVIQVIGDSGLSADEEDLTDRNGILKFKDKEYNIEGASGLGYKILRKNWIEDKNILIQDMINEANTIYEIRYDFDLNEEKIIIPENCVLNFVGGSISNGMILLSNNTNIIGKGNIYISHNIAYPFNSMTGEIVNIYASIIVNGVSNIYINGICFIDSIEGNGNDGVWCYGMRNAPCENIVIENCKFENCGCGFGCNTINSKILNCKFVGDTTHIFNNETYYDFEGRDYDSEEYNGYKCCKNNIFSKNIVKNTHHYVAGENEFQLIWCSGIDGLTISDNYFEFYYSLINLYVGDLNVALRGARVINNYFLYKDDSANRPHPVLLVNGLSWPFQNHIIGTPLIYSETTAIIEKNIFISEIKNNPIKKKDSSAIQCTFMDNVIIRNNIIDGFAYPIALFNTRSSGGQVTLSRYMGKYIIEENTIKNCFASPIQFAKYMLFCNVKHNIFENCGYIRNTVGNVNFWYSGFFELRGIINVFLEENEFLNQASINGGYPDVLFRNVLNSDTTVVPLRYNNGVFRCKTYNNKIAGHIVNPSVYMICSYGDYKINNFGIFSETDVWQIYSIENGLAINVGQRLIEFNTSKQYLCRKSGIIGPNGHSAIVAAAEIGDSILIVPSLDTTIVPGDTLVINDTEYYVNAVFYHVEYVDGSKDYGTIAPGYPRLEIILDKPLNTSIENETTISTQQAITIEI